MSSEGEAAFQALASIRSGLAELAACDVDSYDVGTLGDECAQIMQATGELQTQAARRLARFEALGGPAADNTSSLTAWLGRRCRLRPWEARQLATTATRLHLLDQSRAAFASGEIAFGDLATIAEGIDTAADTMTSDWSPERIAETAQPILIEAAREVTPGQLRKAATRIALTLDGDHVERRRRQIERRSHLDLSQTMDGVGVLRGDVGAADFAILEKTIDTFAPPPDADAPRWMTRPGHRRLKGLITACEVALNAAGRYGYRERGGAPVRVHLIATSATVDPTIPATRAPAGRTEYGTIVSAPEIREMIRRHRAILNTINIDATGRVTDQVTPDGQPLNWGRTRRLFSTAQRDVYLALYTACAADGCDRPPAWADIDHKHAWADGGPTDLDNGQPLCRWHNLRKEHVRARTTPRSRRKDQEGGQPEDGQSPDPDH